MGLSCDSNYRLVLVRQVGDSLGTSVRQKPICLLIAQENTSVLEFVIQWDLISLDNNNGSDPALDSEKGLVPALRTLPLGRITSTEKMKITISYFKEINASQCWNNLESDSLVFQGHSAELMFD